MRSFPLVALSAVLITSFLAPPTATAKGSLYGKIYTDDGDVYTGAMRWDKNENFWDDVLDARKDKKVRAISARKEVKILGLKISKSGEWNSVRSEFSIPFGHIASIEPARGERVDLELKSGEVIVVREGADMGDSMRGLIVYDEEQGEVNLDWKSVDRIEFSGDSTNRDNQRLYGTVQTRRAKFTGYIVWDRDESLVGDILDGEAGGKKYKIPFAKIKHIRRKGSKASEITLANGRTHVLRGTNDVNDENRGIDITVPGVGKVEVGWDQFREVHFENPPGSLAYNEFDGGSLLHGTVETADGDTYEGQIIWDNDEEYSWEALNGETVGVDFAILFENIASIERASRQAAEVVLHNGNTFILEGSNDVDSDNKGIVVIEEDGSEVQIGWKEFHRATFRQ